MTKHTNNTMQSNKIAYFMFFLYTRDNRPFVNIINVIKMPLGSISNLFIAKK